MCLSPIRARNLVKRVGLDLNQPFSIEFPCGQCSECRELRKSEWYFRTYWQCQEVINNGGYVYFDTLTYSDENLPYADVILSRDFNLHDMDDVCHIPCFDVEDYRLFFQRLRRQLEYAGYGRDCISYFLSSEYGTSDKGTHRPHYHVLFFVKNYDISPIELSKLVNKCWQKGRTDGIDYHPYAYVYKHIFRFGSVDSKHLQSICNYVAKYVNKEPEFQKEIDKRLRVLFDNIFSREDWMYNERAVERFKAMMKCCNQFHRQSKGFGEYYLEQLSQSDFDDMVHSGMMRMPDSRKVVKQIPIAQYYKMKLFYEQYDYRDGSKHWRLSEYGKMWKNMRLKDSIRRFVDKMNDWYMSIPHRLQFIDDDLLLDPFNTVQQQVISLLGSRSWYDYAVYRFIYYGRVRSQRAILTGVADDLDTMFCHRYVDEFDLDVAELSGRVLYNYSSPSERKVFKDKFLSKRDLGNIHQGINSVYAFNGYDVDSEYTSGYIKDKLSSDYISAKDFVLLFCYNEDSDVRFHDFDKLTDLIRRFNSGYNKVKQKTYDKIEAQKRRYKNILGSNI